MSNSVRQQDEDQLNELQKQYRMTKEALQDRDRLLQTYKDKFDKDEQSAEVIRKLKEEKYLLEQIATRLTRENADLKQQKEELKNSNDEMNKKISEEVNVAGWNFAG